MAGLDGAQATYCTGSCHRRWGRGAVTLRKGFALSLGNNRCENRLSHLIQLFKIFARGVRKEKKEKITGPFVEMRGRHTRYSKAHVARWRRQRRGGGGGCTQTSTGEIS